MSKKFYAKIDDAGLVLQVIAYNGLLGDMDGFIEINSAASDVLSDIDKSYFIENGILIERDRDIPAIEKRYRAYPDAAEQLGSLIQAVLALEAGQSIPDEARAVFQRVLDIQQQFPD